MARVLCAMSGGVDSSVAAALLAEQGHEVIGVTMQVWPDLGPEEEARRGGCCSLGAVNDARLVADALGIPYYVVNLRAEFERAVIDYFAAEYAAGRTPNPCIACNRFVKFDALLRKALELGCDYVATGHYARVEDDPATGRRLLRRSADPHKDQTYALYGLTQAQLRRALFPVGGMTKDEVRARAERLGLPVARKPDSQEICFVVDGDHGAVVAARRPEAARPGPVYDLDGRLLGTHRGLAYYTVGQRRGLGLRAPGPWYVTALDPDRNAVIVGREDDVLAPGLVAGELNWVSLPCLEAPRRLGACIRYRSPEVPAEVRPLPGGRVEVRFERPQRAVTPGQAVVFYDGDLVVGGGVIERALAARSA